LRTCLRAAAAVIAVIATAILSFAILIAAIIAPASVTFVAVVAVAIGLRQDSSAIQERQCKHGRKDAPHHRILLLQTTS
jgi:hypothetical protein